MPPNWPLGTIKGERRVMPIRAHTLGSCSLAMWLGNTMNLDGHWCPLSETKRIIIAWGQVRWWKSWGPCLAPRMLSTTGSVSPHQPPVRDMLQFLLASSGSLSHCCKSVWLHTALLFTSYGCQRGNQPQCHVFSISVKALLREERVFPPMSLHL